MGSVLGIAGGLFAFRMAGLQRRYQLAEQYSSARDALGLAGRVGGAIGTVGYGADLGIGAMESAQMRREFFRSSGTPGALRGHSLARLSRSSLSVGAMGSYAGLRAAGAGGSGGNMTKMVRIAQQAGLYGSKGDQYLQIVAQATSRMADRGMTLDLDATERFLARYTSAPLKHGPGASSKSHGLAAARLAGGIAGAAGSARDQLMAPFQGMAQAAFLAKAMQGGGGFLDIADRLGGMANPSNGSAVLREMFGTRLSADVLGGLGATSALARDVARNRPLNPTGALGGLDHAGDRGLGKFRVPEAKMMKRANKGSKHLVDQYMKYQGLLVQAGGTPQESAGAVSSLVQELTADIAKGVASNMKAAFKEIGDASRDNLWEPLAKVLFGGLKELFLTDLTDAMEQAVRRAQQ